MQLPPQLHQQLERWYTITCLLFVITFLLLSGVHSFTLYKLYKNPQIENFEALNSPGLPALASADAEKNNAQEIIALTHKHAGMLKTLHRAVNAIPETIAINKLVIEPETKIEYHGYTQDQAEINIFLSQLQQVNLSEIIKLETEPAKDTDKNTGTINFHLSIKTTS